MDFNQYQKEAAKTAQYPECHVGFVDNGHDCCKSASYLYPVLGLVGEAGEVAEKIKKIIRNKAGTPSEEDIQEIAKELGDVLWYIAALCTELELEMDTVATNNIAKLQDRLKRDKIKSEGDNR
jgi:NTP pyrophosphatase (non-canonical NTP hydrolase)